MRALLRLFPRQWRDRYGEDFVDHFGHDPRRFTKWVDAVRTVAALQWTVFRASADGVAAGLVGALGLTLVCDVALGVGMDERIDVALLEHWWGAPFAAVFALSAAMATGSLVAILGDRQGLRSATVLGAGMAAGAVAGSAVLAAASFDLAGVGAGVGLAVAIASARACLRTPLARIDGLLALAVPMIVVLGWRSASSPVGPLVLLVIAGALIATRTQPPGPVSGEQAIEHS
ncbi:MAG: hypothetical protein M3R01_06840 [Actinomycetota bacterium]|nr:hypothetical protein [Actinomycetota bacterium]